MQSLLRTGGGGYHPKCGRVDQQYDQWKDYGENPAYSAAMERVALMSFSASTM